MPKTAAQSEPPRTGATNLVAGWLIMWFANLSYSVLLVLVSPVLIWRMVRHGKYLDGWSQKFLGNLPKSAAGEHVVWFHAVSVGEVLQLETIVPRLVAERPDATVLITSTTNTGLEVARQKFPEHRCCYFPLDFSWAANRALKRVRPQLVVLVELELWPNFILSAARRRVRLAMINGRMSERSFRGYKRIRPLIASVLKRFNAIGVQTEQYASRLRALGASEVVVTGSIKFDRIETDRKNLHTQELRDHFGIKDTDTVFIAGSTQAPEEDMAIRTWMTLREQHPSLRLVVVPRHRERFDEVATLITSHGLNVLRRSVPSRDQNPNSVALLDTLGELSHCWGLADIAFVGGSFGDRGGQNMIEPAAYGAAIVVGPNTRNFADVVSSLETQKAIHVVHSTDKFTATVDSLLQYPEETNETGLRAQKWVCSQGGASLKTLELLIELMPSNSHIRSSRYGNAA